GQRATKCLARRRLVAEARFGGSERREEERVVGREREGSYEVGTRCAAVASLQRVASAAEEPARLFRIEVDGGVEERAGAGGIAAEVVEEVGEVPHRRRAARIDAQRILECGERLVVAMLLAEDDAFVVERPGSARR